MHALRRGDPEFEDIGEVYFSCVNPQAIKAWHLHREMTLHYVCVSGAIKLVLYDDRSDSSTRGHLMEIFLGPDSYQLVKIPHGIWNGFKGVAAAPSIVCNCASVPHRPDEIVRKDPFSSDIPYDWDIRHG